MPLTALAANRFDPDPLILTEKISPDTAPDPSKQAPYVEGVIEPSSIGAPPMLLAAKSDDEHAAAPVATAEAPAVAAVSVTQNDFTEALANVYLHHPQLNAQRESLKATDEGVSQAISGFRPTVTAQYNQGRQRTDINNEGWVYQKNKDKVLDITQPIFNGGGTVASYISARDRVRAGQAQLTALEEQILFNAVVAYTDVFAKQSLLEANQANVDTLARQFDATSQRFKVGDLTKTDVAQARARLSLAQAAERQALGDLDSSRATFRRLIGYDPPPAVRLPASPVNLPQDLKQAMDLAETTEPTLEAARQLEKAAESDVYIRTALLLPTVNLEATSARQNNPIPGQFRYNNDMIRVNVTIPLYQSGAEWSRVREAKNLAQQAKFTTLDTHQSVTQNVTQAWDDYQTSQSVIASNEEAVRAAERAVEGIRQENLYGVRTVLDVLNTEQDLFTARVDYINATVIAVQQSYRLLAAVGRLTAKDLSLPVTLNDPAQHYHDVKYKLIGF